MSALRITTLATLSVLLLCTSADAKPRRKRVEAVKGKRYLLRREHDPWMIMVTSLRDVDPLLRTDGLSAWEAADAIIYELRRRGIPAWAYHQKEQMDETGRYVARQEYIAVLAGGFDSPDHRHVQPVLKYIKEKFRPDFLDDDSTGVVRRKTDMPFRGAFVCPNPLRPEIKASAYRSVDPLIRRINSESGPLSLLKNPGRFTVRVATFSGGTVVQVAGRKDDGPLKFFQEHFGKGLDEAGRSAWELATALRQARSLGYDRDFEAWVFHDRYRSYVTIGSFDSPDDPQIAILKREFAAKFQPDPRTGEDRLTPVLFSIPKNPEGKMLPDKLWFFDQNPKVVAVPGREPVRTVSSAR